MSNITASSTSFISRIFQNDAAKKGMAGAVAGLLVAVVTEVLWPAA
jgi:cell division protein FtsX